MIPRQNPSTLAVVDSIDSDLSHTIVWLPVSRLGFEPKFNRAVNERRVAKIVAEFDPDYVGTVTVSERATNSYIVIDGQHRVRAMRLMGWDDQSVECRVYTGLSLPEEARLFNGLNTMIKPLAIDVFRARVIAQEQVACAINDILLDAGLRAAGSNGPGAFSAVAAAEKIYNGTLFREPGIHAAELRASLRILTAAYGVEGTSVQAMLIEGVSRVLHRYGALIDIPALTSKLARLPGGAQGLVGAGKSLHSFKGGSVSRCMAEVIVGIYNKQRRRGALPDWSAPEWSA